MSVSVKITMQDDTDFENMMLSISNDNCFKLLHLNRKQMNLLYADLIRAHHIEHEKYQKGDPHPKICIKLNNDRYTYEYRVWMLMLDIVGDWFELSCKYDESVEIS